MNKKNFRIEHDFLGEREIQNDCYYGIQTLRAVENIAFHVIGADVTITMADEISCP